MQLNHAFLLLLLAAACQSPTSTDKKMTTPTSAFQPEKFGLPRAAQIPKTLTTAFGDTRTDEYYWLNQRENPEVIAYLEAENRYADSVLQPVEALREQLFQELKARVKEDDASVPYLKNGYWYITRYETGKEYPIFTRKEGTLDAPESILLDVNELAKGHAYCQAGDLSVSPDNRWMAYTVDYSGRNLFNVFFKNLETGETLAEHFETAGTMEWANDSKTLLYDTKDKVTLRTDKIWRHVVGTSHKSDVMMYHEKDETQYAYMNKSKDDQFFFINCAYTQVVEVLYLNANEPTGTFKVVRPREPEFFYSLEHHNGQFLIRTNWNAPNFRLMTAPSSNPAREQWADLVAHSDEVLIDGVEVFKDYLVIAERKGGLSQLRIRRWADGAEHYLETGEPTYAISPDMNPEYNTATLRYNFSSLKTPYTVIDYDMNSRAKNVKKVAPVLGGFDSNNYATELVWVTARDGVKVPMSLVYRKGTSRDGSAPCHLTGYGSYGFSYDPSFNRDKLSLLDRGFVVGIAHIRGGMEMGYKWYENGKMLNKMNTFNDFIDCSDYLVQQKYTSSDRLFVEGRSAGGLLMGAIVNMRPDLFKGIITGVPFVDVLTTMSDPSIPLTTGEYSEWGNPAVQVQYNYMKQYSPYDNLKKGSYPHMLVLTSLNDSQVQYFEPAKYVARLRDLKTDQNMLLLKTSMSGSHGGSSGRFERLKERALEYAWMLGIMGKTEVRN
jgi:oligopeptidase B